MARSLGLPGPGEGKVELSPTPPTRVFLVRHGETEWNLTRRAQGHADVPLNEAGRRQARHVAEELFDANFAAVYSSDLSRAYDTAWAIAESHGLGVVADPTWREIDQGEWEGLGNDEIKRRWPALWDPEKRWSEPRPGGESPGEVLERALGGLARIAERHPGEHVVVVTHGGVIRWLTAHATGAGLAGSGRVRGIGNGGVLEMDVSIEDGALRFGDVIRIDGRDTSYGDPNA